jgi:hypothetical protein
VITSTAETATDTSPTRDAKKRNKKTTKREPSGSAQPRTAATQEVASREIYCDDRPMR